MKRLLLAAVAISVLMAMASASQAASSVKGSKSNSSDRSKGKFVTATAQVQGSTCSAGPYAIPTTAQFFILTQFCSGADAIQLVNVGTGGLGSIAQTGDGQTCITFTPGVYLPRGSSLSCCNMTANEGFCMISGLESP